MARLNITTATALGPLSVEVLGPRGKRVAAPMLMSSLRQQAEVEVDVPGEYLVVATRPSGEQLVSAATVGPNGGYATIKMAGASPREFLLDAARFGLAYAPQTAERPPFLATALGSPRAANTASRSLSALFGKANLSADQRFALTDEGIPSQRAAPVAHQLVAWRYHHRSWHRTEAPPAQPDAEGDYLQLKLLDTAPLALGLLNTNGFGPIVTIPQFVGGITLTFLAPGVAMEDSADRVRNPSAVRVPVALATPNDPGMADLLVGMGASVLPQATQLLQQGRGGSAEAALNLLAEKFNDPAAAVLGGLFLARFAPERLPLPWLRNLNGILPDVADSWVLLAWARSVQGDGSVAWEESIADQLRRARACRCTLFSRTRYQLAQLAWRYGPYPRARQEEVVTPRRARPGDFLDFAAEAGGLEAFWGYSPTRPGGSYEPPIHPPQGRTVTVRAGRFTAAA